MISPRTSMDLILVCAGLSALIFYSVCYFLPCAISYAAYAANARPFSAHYTVPVPGPFLVRSQITNIDKVIRFTDQIHSLSQASKSGAEESNYRRARKSRTKSP